jgi:hypothetical protein
VDGAVGADDPVDGFPDEDEPDEPEVSDDPDFSVDAAEPPSEDEDVPEPLDEPAPDVADEPERESVR